MGSLFEIGKSGVQAYRQALSVTGQNIANINTEGYNKRAADLEEVPSVQGGVTNVPDSSGLGVRVNQIRRSFDTFLAANTRNTNSEFQKLDTFVKNLNQLENMLLPSESDLGTFIGRFFNSLQEVASRPDDLAARSVAIEAGKALSGSFNSYDNNLNGLKNSSEKEVNNALTQINLIVKELSNVNKLIMSGGSQNTSSDILDARDKLLFELSKYLNFTADYGKNGDVKVSIGNSGSGKVLIDKTNFSSLSSVIQEKRVIFKISRDGIVTNVNDFSGGLLLGLKNYFDLVDDVQSEISNLALRLANNFNEIQMNGIDLNGKNGLAMFSTDSMSVDYTGLNENFDVDLIVGNPELVKQEKMQFKFISSLNSWEVSSSEGIKVYNNDQLYFPGMEVRTKGNPRDGETFSIKPSSTNSGSIKFILNDVKSIAAASKSIISSSFKNLSESKLSVLGQSDEEIAKIAKLEEVFTPSSDPLLATSFLREGALSIIPSNVSELKISSLTKQSSASFGIHDSQIKGFSNITINLSDGTSVDLSSATSDPGDGIKTVEELARMLNSGLLLDGLKKHNFRNYGLFASGADGALTISSSNASVTSASILADGSSYSASISSIDSSDSQASEIQIFTRDGRHISGKALSSSEIARIVNTSNGFFKNAEYRNDYLNLDYRGINSSRISVNGDHISNIIPNISYNKQATDEDGLFTNKDATSLSGTLTLDGTLKGSQNMDAFVTITSELNDSGITFTVDGYDRDGKFVQETITGGNKSTVTGTKVFKSISQISSSGNAAGDLKIGLKASGQSIKITNENNESITSSIPIEASAYYIANKMKSDLSGTGINITATNKALIGPLKENSSGTFSFKLKSKNSEDVIISSVVDYRNLSNLARLINQFTPQTGVTAVSSSDFKRIILDAEQGHDIELTEIVAPSDFNVVGLNEKYEQITETHTIDISDSNEKSAFIKGHVKFQSTSSFTTQIGSGLIKSSSQDQSVNGFYDVSYGSGGETISVKPITFDNLDDNVRGTNGKKAQVGESQYGLGISMNSYSLEVNDDDSLFQYSNPGSAGTLTLNGQLRNSTRLDQIVTIFCEANESSNSFKITGTDSEGNTVKETITGVNASSISGSQKFFSITSIETTASANGRVKIGTMGSNAVDDIQSLVENNNFSAGTVTLNGRLSSATYLGAKIQIKSFGDDSSNSFTIVGTDLDGKALQEVIVGTNGSVAIGNQVFKTVTQITAASSTNKNISVGTKQGDVSWNAEIDGNEINAKTSSELSLALVNKIREEAPTSLLTGKVLNQLPSEGTTVDLLFEGQVYKLSMKSGEVIVEGLEANRVKARIEETVEFDQDALGVSQDGSSGVALTLNGAQAGSIFAGTRVSVSAVGDETSNKFTVVGTDLDGNSLSESFYGPDSGKTINGLKIFKTITSITPSASTSGKVEIGTASGYKFSVIAEGTVEGDQFDLIENSTNISNASQFGLSEGTTSLIGNLAYKPLISNEAENLPFKINVDNGSSTDVYKVKFLSDNSSTSIMSANNVSNLSSISAVDNLGGKITITTASGGNHSSASFTVSGTDMSGNSITEVISGALGDATSTGEKVFKKVTSVTVSSAGSGNISIGHESQPVFFNETQNFRLFSAKTLSASTSLGTIPSFNNLGGRIKINASHNQSSTSFTVAGKDSSGSNITETITGPGAGESILGSKIFKSITSITPGGSVGSGTVTIDYAVSPAVSLNPPTDITLAWQDNFAGASDADGLLKSSTVTANSSISFDGVLTTTDSDSIFTQKSISTTDKVVLDGVLSKSKNLNAKLQVIFASNETGKTLTINGYDTDGIYQTEIINGASGTVNGTINFDEIISITPSAAMSGNVTIGTQATTVDVNGSIVTITSSANESSNNFTVVGTDMEGNAQTEVIAGGISTIVYGKKVFQSISSITPSANSSSLTIGTEKTGRFTIKHEIGKSNFSLDQNPNIENIYGIKTQSSRLIVDNGEIKLTSLNGEALKLNIPSGSVSNTVNEQITISNLPNEDLIAVVMNDGAKRISAQYDYMNENNLVEETTEYEIKIDETNKNKVEIFDKRYGHSISTRILDNNRVFEAVGSRFQFDIEPANDDSFTINDNTSGSGDNRNIINMIDLQTEKLQSVGKGNFQEIFSNTVAKVGANVQSNKLSLKSAESNRDAAESAQSEFSGVSLDEEASHILEFQQAYQASARLLQTAKELFDSLIQVV